MQADWNRIERSPPLQWLVAGWSRGDWVVALMLGTISTSMVSDVFDVGTTLTPKRKKEGVVTTGIFKTHIQPR